MKQNTKKTDEAQHLNTLLSNGTVEIRAMDKTNNRIWSGVYSDYDQITSAINHAHVMKWDIYSTINPSKIPATNGKLRPYQRTTRDADIIEIRKIFFDLDPVRETGKPSDEYQIREAHFRATVLSEFLQDRGWGTPTMGFSGNGYHLYYNTRLPVENSKDLMNKIYQGLDIRFSDELVNFDTTVRNPARIARVLGTINLKSGTKSRAKYHDNFVKPELISRLADEIAPPKPKPHWVSTGEEKRAGSFIKNWNIVSAFQKNGLYLDSSSDVGKHFVTCPWSHEHSFTGPKDTIIFEGEWPQFHCSHAHCSHRSVSDVIDLFGVHHDL